MYEFHSDAGHAWLAVPIHHLEELNIANKISTYSYMKDGIAYLEEDCDAGIFIKSFFEKYGEKPQIKEDTSGVNENIRTLETYHWSNIIQERAGLI